MTARQPCPECGAPLYRWRSLAFDGEDTDPRATCTNPECDFEY